MIEFKWFTPVSTLKANKNLWRQVKKKFNVTNLDQLFKILIEQVRKVD